LRTEVAQVSPYESKMSYHSHHSINVYSNFLNSLGPLFTVYYLVHLSPDTLAAIVAEFGDNCRRIRRQSPFSVTVAEFGDYIASVDRALRARWKLFVGCRCGEAVIGTCTSYSALKLQVV